MSIYGEFKDDDHRRVKVDSEGRLLVSSDNLESLLAGVLKELKIMNLHLMVLTDNVFTKEDVNG